MYVNLQFFQKNHLLISVCYRKYRWTPFLRQLTSCSGFESNSLSEKKQKVWEMVLWNFANNLQVNFMRHDSYLYRQSWEYLLIFVMKYERPNGILLILFKKLIRQVYEETLISETVIVYYQHLTLKTIPKSLQDWWGKDNIFWNFQIGIHCTCELLQSVWASRLWAILRVNVCEWEKLTTHQGANQRAPW